MPAHAEPAADHAPLSCRAVQNMVDVSVPTDIIVQIVRGSRVDPGATACLQRAHAQQTVVDAARESGGGAGAEKPEAPARKDVPLPHQGQAPGVPGAPTYRLDLGLPFEGWQLDPVPMAPGSQDWGLSFQLSASGHEDER